MRKNTISQAWTLHKVKRSFNSLLLSKIAYKAIPLGPSTLKTSVNERDTTSKVYVFFLRVNCKMLTIVNEFPTRIRTEQTNRTTASEMWASAVSVGNSRSPFVLMSAMMLKFLAMELSLILQMIQFFCRNIFADVVCTFRQNKYYKLWEQISY